MQYKICKNRTPVVSILFLPLFLLASPAMGNEDDYLKALEAEAESSSNVQNPDQAQAEEAPAQDNGHRKEFEQRLAQQLPATFKTYRMLTDEQKRTVIDTYFENGRNMPVATRVLFNLYFKVR